MNKTIPRCKSCGELAHECRRVDTMPEWQRGCNAHRGAEVTYSTQTDGFALSCMLRADRPFSVLSPPQEAECLSGCVSAYLPWGKCSIPPHLQRWGQFLVNSPKGAPTATRKGLNFSNPNITLIHNFLLPGIYILCNLFHHPCYA